MNMKTVAVSAAIMMSAATAQAATLTGDFDVTPAVSDRNGTPISLWFDTVIMNELSKINDSADPTFSLTETGSFRPDSETDTLTGRAAQLSSPDDGFSFTFDFDRDFTDNDVQPEFEPVFSDVNPNQDVEFFDVEGGTLSGFGAFEGLVFGLGRLPIDGAKAVQVGEGVDGDFGPNLHNSNFGMAFWFRLDTLVSADCLACDVLDTDAMLGQQADINVDLSPSAVPLPAGAALLLTAMGGLGIAARKRKAS